MEIRRGRIGIEQTWRRLWRVRSNTIKRKPMFERNKADPSPLPPPPTRIAPDRKSLSGGRTNDVIYQKHFLCRHRTQPIYSPTEPKTVQNGRDNSLSLVTDLSRDRKWFWGHISTWRKPAVAWKNLSTEISQSIKQNCCNVIDFRINIISRPYSFISMKLQTERCIITKTMVGHVASYG